MPSSGLLKELRGPKPLLCQREGASELRCVPMEHNDIHNDYGGTEKEKMRGVEGKKGPHLYTTVERQKGRVLEKTYLFCNSELLSTLGCGG